MQQLFQQRVLNDFIDKQNETLIKSRWAKFQNFLAKKEQIKTFIETDYQTEFLQDVFENSLGYISKTQSLDGKYTLEREKKNQTNAQKADGAILVDEKVVAVIELKDLNTSDLDKKYSRDESAIKQAFGYLQYNDNAKYVIVSNFNELRFYLDKATAYERFYLFDLDYEGFKKLHTLLSYESISTNLPLIIKEKSINFEKDISNQLYKDYTSFRTKLFENVLLNNENKDKLELLNATQKLIDRIVFILFAEDTELLPTNTIPTIIEKYKKQDLTDYTLYEIYKIYFEAINSGNERLNITKYNGGLFAKDAFLDTLIIDDTVLNAQAKVLSAYNFGSEISVNILGHIFENSISELEEMSAQLQNTSFDKKQSKRKKDGVFYTPEYITRYIVENTLGKLCADKKEELNIHEIHMPSNPKKPTKKEQEQKDSLEIYRNYLLELKILDPACGSGAFLNQALEFLISEHKKLQRDLAIMGDITAYYDIEPSILEHNLYGVDINEGAVEIARLSLWLRSAKKGRTLTNLSDKIVCANSLLHMPFEEGYFDVVIGNPPYVRQEMIDNEIKEKYIENYKNVAMTTADLYVYFYELSIKLLKKRGLLGFITPNKWMERKYGLNLRTYLKSYNIKQLINFGELNIFDDASTEPAIIILENQISDKDILYAMIKSIEEAQSGDYKTLFYKKDELSDDIWRFTNPLTTSILVKFKDADTTLKKYTDNGGFRGILTGLNKAFIINENTYQEILSKDKNSNQLLKKMVEGDDFGKWELNHSGRYMVATGYDLDIREKYPAVFEYLECFRDELIKRQDKGVHYWNLRACDYYDKLEEPKLIYYHTALNHKFYYDSEGYYISANCYFIANADKYLQSVLNSKLFSFVKKYLFPAFGDAEKGGRVRLDANKMNSLPIKKIQTLAIPHANISKLLQLQSQKRYDKEAKIKVASHNEKDIFITEFLFAKIQSMLESHHGHKEIAQNYVKLLPFIFAYHDEIIEDTRNGRTIISVFDSEQRRVFHVLDENNFLVSLFVMRKETFARSKQYIIKSVREGGVSSILSPAMPFWRHTDLIEELYTHFSNNYTTQEAFIVLVDEILESKNRIKKYKKHYESLSAVDKIEINEAIEKLELRVVACENEIDAMVYKLYGLSDEEIGIVEGK